MPKTGSRFSSSTNSSALIDFRAPITLSIVVWAFAPFIAEYCRSIGAGFTFPGGGEKL